MRVKDQLSIRPRTVDSEGNVIESATLRRENKENKRLVESLRHDKERLQQQLKEKSEELLKEKQKNEALESRVAKLEIELDSFRSMPEENKDTESTDGPQTASLSQQVASKTSVKASLHDITTLPSALLSKERLTPSIEETEENDDKRVMPLNLMPKKEAPSSGKENCGTNRAVSKWTVTVQPGEADFGSDKFRQYLKRRRQMCDGRPNYKYVEVVRNQQERSQLEAFECADCKAFYASLNIEADKMQCQHYKTPQNMGDKIRREAGRHRARFKPPRTPRNYWDMDFPDSIERKKKEKQKQSEPTTL